MQPSFDLSGLALVSLTLLSLVVEAAPVSQESTNSSGEHYSWTNLPLIGLGPRQETAITALGSLVYVIGGVDYNEESEIQTLNRVEFFDTLDKSWHVAAPLPQPLNHANVASINDKIYVIGALNGGYDWAVVPDGYVYYPNNDTWLHETFMPIDTARGASAVGEYGSKIYIAGGMTVLDANQVGYQDSVAEVSSYDVETQQWGTDLPVLPQPRQHVGGAVVGSTFYVIGGRENGIEQYHNTTYALDLNNPTAWRTLAPMPTARGSLTCSAIQKKIFCFGGEGNPQSWKKIFNETQVYDTTTNTWETLHPMPVPRHGTGSVTVGDRIYIPGGGAETAMFPVGIMDSFGPA